MATTPAQLLQAVYGSPSQELSAVAASQPLPDILASILSNNEPATAEATGETSDLQTEVGTFVSRAGHTNGLSSPADLSELNEHLLSRTYLVAGRKTAADVAVLGALHPWLAAASKEERLRYPALTRFLDLLQHDEAIVKTGLLQENKVEVDDVPKTQRTPAAAAKVKDSKAKAAVPEGAATAKKEKKPKEKAAEKPPAAGDGPPRPSHIDLRVGRIVDVKKHPDADSLYVEQIDLGEPEGPRTVVSGLVNYIPIEQMQNRLLIAVCNLKPANMRGVKSHAMVLCATSPEGKEGPGSIEIVEVPEGSEPGDRIFFEGCENELPLEQLPPKKKIFETIQPGFTTLETREAAWRDPSDPTKVLRIVSKKGPCRAPTFVGATLS